MTDINVGIVGTGIYIPEGRMTAKEISQATKGYWAEEAVIEKLGIIEKPIPGPNDGTQEMGVRAGLDCLERTGIDPKEIDLILCMGEEWKEYPLTTSASIFRKNRSHQCLGHRCSAEVLYHSSCHEDGQGHDDCR